LCTARSTNYENNYRPPQATEINALLEQARAERLLVRAADGTEFMLSPLEDFDQEIACTRQNAELMALLDERGKQSTTVPLNDLKRQLDLDQ
jgi:hypothetical protein